MEKFEYDLKEDTGATLGLVVLRTDETIETEFRKYFDPDEARMHICRVHAGDELSPETISEMGADIGNAVSLLPRAAEFDVIGYACTSGTAHLGADRVQSVVSENATTRAVTNPLTSAIEAIKDQGLQRVGIVSPYVESVAAPLREAFENNGIQVPDALSFGEEVEARVARIDPASIAHAARALATRTSMDGVFLSCTNLKTIDLLGPLAAELGMPVLSSNQALAWHMRKLAGMEDAAT